MSNPAMKPACRILIAITLLITAVTVGYVLGRRDGTTAERRDTLQTASMIAEAIRVNRSDLALRLAEQEMDYSALGWRQYERLINPMNVLGEIPKEHFYGMAFQHASRYINEYPHPDISVPAIAYIQTQQKSERDKKR